MAAKADEKDKKNDDTDGVWMVSVDELDSEACATNYEMWTENELDRLIAMMLA